MSDFPLSISMSALKKSSKKEGKYEKYLVEYTSTFFLKMNYEVKKHISLNFAWGSVLSEVDIIAFKNNNITIIEVKSKNDKITHAKNQFNKLKNFIDYFYVASNGNINNNNFGEDIGLIKINNDIKIIKPARLLNNKILCEDLLRLKKKCLIMLNNGEKGEKHLLKKDIVKRVLTKYDGNKIKIKVKKIILCNYDCDKCNI